MLKRISIKSKLRLLLCFLIAVAVVVGAMGVVGMLQLNNNQNKLYQITNNNMHVERMLSSILDLRIQLREARSNVGDPQAVAEIVEYMRNIDVQITAEMEQVKGQFFTERGHAVFEELEAHHAYLLTVRPDYYQMALDGDGESMSAWLGANLANALRFQDLCTELGQLGLNLAEEISTQDTALAYFLIALTLVITLISLTAAAILGTYITRIISRPIQKMAEASEQLAAGNINTDIQVDSADEIGVLSQAFRKMIDSISVQAGTLAAIAEGDYTVSVPLRSKEDVINQSINELVKDCNEIMTEIRIASAQVSTGAEQISQAAQGLSVGSSQQSSNVTEFSSTLQDVLHRAQDHSTVANRALAVTSKVDETVGMSTDAMEGVLEAMRSIDESTKGVANIIKFIEDIAFQTNILSLNAAVEAARAGQQGKGFAVVADEVRNLAAKSAKAAQDTSVLIDGSLSRVSQGNAMVESANRSMAQMKESVLDAISLFQNIAEGSMEQERAIREIEQGIDQIAKVVQDNSATAEEAAATAEELNAQSLALHELISRFRTKSSMEMISMEPRHRRSPAPRVETSMAVSKY